MNEMNETLSLEQAILDRLAAPIRTKQGTLAVDENGNPLSATQAIAMSITQNAMRGDLAAASFIRNLTRSTAPADTERQARYEKRKAEAFAKVRAQFEKEGIWVGQELETERIAATMLLLEDLEEQMRAPGYEDIVVEYSRTGTATQRANPLHDLHDRYVKQLDERMQATRVAARIQKNNLKRK